MADRVTMSIQAYVDEAGDDQLVYLKDESAIHVDQDSGSTKVNFTDADLDAGIVSLPTFISKINSGMYIKNFFRDFIEGMSYVMDNSDIVNNLTTSASGKVLDASQGYALQQNKVDKSSIKNNLTTTSAGYVLDARQGRALNIALTGKIDASKIANNVTTTESGYVLDARQGKVLYDAISTSASGLTPADIANNLTTTTSGKVLDAYQGYLLSKNKLDASKRKNNLTTTSSGYVLDAYQGYILNQNKIGTSEIINNLTTSASGKVLDASQGYQLNQLINTASTSIANLESSKVDKTSIANNLTTTASGYVLDARQGRLLFNSVAQNFGIVVDDISSTATQAIPKDSYFIYYDSSYGMRLCKALKDIAVGDSFVRTGSNPNYEYSTNWLSDNSSENILDQLGNAAYLNYAQVTSGLT